MDDGGSGSTSSSASAARVGDPLTAERDVRGSGGGVGHSIGVSVAVGVQGRPTRRSPAAEEIDAEDTERVGEPMDASPLASRRRNLQPEGSECLIVITEWFEPSPTPAR